MRSGTDARDFRPGDWVIYRVFKHSAHPGRRARAISANERGEFYSYVIDKQWTVREVRDDGRIVVTTRRGKQRLVSAEDESLRRPSLWERWRLRDRFPKPPEPPLPGCH